MKKIALYLTVLLAVSLGFVACDQKQIIKENKSDSAQVSASTEETLEPNSKISKEYGIQLRPYEKIRKLKKDISYLKGVLTPDLKEQLFQLGANVPARILYNDTILYASLKMDLPEITWFRSGEKTLSINKLIKDAAQAVLPQSADQFAEDVDFEIKTTLMLESANILSIHYQVHSMIWGYGGDTYALTTNINLEREERITLNDIVDIDEEFASIVQDKYFEKFEFPQNKSKFDENIEKTIEKLKQADALGLTGDSTVYSYFTKEGLTLLIHYHIDPFSLEEIEFNWKELEKFLKLKPIFHLE